MSGNIKIQIIILILASAICFFSSVYAYFRAEPIVLLSLPLVSLLFSILFLFVTSVIKKKYLSKNGSDSLIVFLVTYIVLVLWLGVYKVMPEYIDINEFENRHLDLIHKSLETEFDKVEFARFYMKAPDVIERIYPGIHHKGNMAMHQFLMKKIQEGKGEDYVDDLFFLAETGFTYTSKGYAYNWYSKAFKFGKQDALKRYDERLAEFGLTREMVLK